MDSTQYWESDCNVVDHRLSSVKRGKRLETKHLHYFDIDFCLQITHNCGSIDMFLCNGSHFLCTQVFQSAQELLQGYQVHPEIQAQMFAYLFFFSNVSLFNQLMDKGREKKHTHPHFLFH